jgi:hypothetical protein
MSYDDGSSAFKLREEFRDFGKDSPDVEPLDAKFSYGEFQLVGHGKVTNERCGTFSSYWGCVRTELHHQLSLDHKDFTLRTKKRVYVRKVHHSCDKPSCPICFKYGWAVREAMKIEARLKEGQKHFGVVEHVVASVPVRDYGLDFNELRLKAVKALFDRGIVGGVLIFHGFRYNLRHYWYWSPHFHVLGFILGGYMCRGCKKGCVGCNGFEGRTRRMFERDGYIVKVLGERKTVGGTAWYQLNHASIKVGVCRFHVATWFGNCSYRKLKVTAEMRKQVCPICNHELVKLWYFGAKKIPLDRSSPDFRRDFVDELEESGREVWVVATRE